MRAIESDRPRPAPRAGFKLGVRAAFHGFGFLRRYPGLWLFALVPVGIVVVLETATVLYLWHESERLRQWVMASAPAPVAGALGILASAAVVSLGAWLAYLLLVLVAPALSSPAMEALVGAQERALGLTRARGASTWRQFVVGLRAQLWIVLAAAGPGLALWALGLFVPALAPLVGVLQLLLFANVVAWNFLDYPMSLRGIAIRDRLRILRRHYPAVAGFGLGFALLLHVPCVGLLMLPAGAVGATWLVHQFPDQPLGQD